MKILQIYLCHDFEKEGEVLFFGAFEVFEVVGATFWLDEIEGWVGAGYVSQVLHRLSQNFVVLLHREVK